MIVFHLPQVYLFFLTLARNVPIYVFLLDNEAFLLATGYLRCAARQSKNASV